MVTSSTIQSVQKEKEQEEKEKEKIAHLYLRISLFGATTSWAARHTIVCIDYCIKSYRRITTDL